MSKLFNHEVVIMDVFSLVSREVRFLGVGWLGCTVPVGYPDADRSASGTV